MNNTLTQTKLPLYKSCKRSIIKQEPANIGVSQKRYFKNKQYVCENPDETMDRNYYIERGKMRAEEGYRYFDLNK